MKREIVGFSCVDYPGSLLVFNFIGTSGVGTRWGEQLLVTGKEPQK